MSICRSIMFVNSMGGMENPTVLNAVGCILGSISESRCVYLIAVGVTIRG